MYNLRFFFVHIDVCIFISIHIMCVHVILISFLKWWQYSPSNSRAVQITKQTVRNCRIHFMLSILLSVSLFSLTLAENLFRHPPKPIIAHIASNLYLMKCQRITTMNERNAKLYRVTAYSLSFSCCVVWRVFFLNFRLRDFNCANLFIYCENVRIS